MPEFHHPAANLVIMRELLDKHPFDEGLKASEFIKSYWQYYTEEFPSSNSVNGAIFENLIIIALARSGITNIYYQTELTYVHSAIFDVFLYHETGSVAISIKTTLRERWKQADLEALAIKQVHKDVKCYVFTLSHPEVNARRKNDKSYAGLDGFILADTQELDLLLEELHQKEFSVAGTITIIKTDHKLYTLKKLENDFHLKILK